MTTIWPAQDRAKMTGDRLYDALRSYLEDLPREEADALTDLVEQALADEYEAGYETGYAQHPGKRKARK